VKKPTRRDRLTVSSRAPEQSTLDFQLTIPSDSMPHAFHFFRPAFLYAHLNYHWTCEPSHSPRPLLLLFARACVLPASTCSSRFTLDAFSLPCTLDAISLPCTRVMQRHFTIDPVLHPCYAPSPHKLLCPVLCVVVVVLCVLMHCHCTSYFVLCTHGMHPYRTTYCRAGPMFMQMFILPEVECYSRPHV
jgi:hypothetical protein